jgi:hypothetical protein
MTTTPRLGATEWAASQAAPNLTVNEAIRKVEQGASAFIAKDKDLATPPGSPVNGDCYIVDAAATGAWVGEEDSLAIYNSGWSFVVPIEGTQAYLQDENAVYRYDGSVWAGPFFAVPVQPIIIAMGDETTAITTGTAKVTFRMPYGFALTEVRASLTTASSSGVVTVDINETGATILSTKLTIDAGETTSTTAAAAAVISDAALADDAEMTLDIDTSGTGAAGLKVTLIGSKT